MAKGATVAAGAAPKLMATDIGEFVRFGSCERRLRLSLDDGAIVRNLPFHDRLFNPLDPVLSMAGREAEEVWSNELIAAGYRRLDCYDETLREAPLSRFLPLLDGLEPGTKAFVREAGLAITMGGFRVSGRMDFLIIDWEGSRPVLRVVEGKASRRDKTYQRIQLATYAVILEKLLRDTTFSVAGEPMEPASVSYAVIRIDEDTNRPQSILGLSGLDLTVEKQDVIRFFASDGVFPRVAGCDVEELDYRIDQKCDSCRFSIHCLPESARLRKLELAGLAPSVNKVLRNHGIYTIDHLASLDPSSAVAEDIRQTDGFSANLGNLVEKAKARRSTLIRGEDDPDWATVRSLKNPGISQLPAHEIEGDRLVRVYMEVNYDYVENRVGAIAAHVTSSDFQLITPFGEDRRPVAGVVEHRPIPVAQRRIVDERELIAARALADACRADRRPLRGRDVVHYMNQPWQGDLVADNAAERQVLQSFFGDLVDAIAEAAGGAEAARIHFYVYARGEMTQLIEACTRCEAQGRGTSLLRHLRELLGCRESLEQLIFSCIGEEIHNRFALGWTGRGLAVATSLSWFGQRYHWHREAGGRAHELDREFVQDIFDFKSTLALMPDDTWATDKGQKGLAGSGVASPGHRFEIRSRFHDTLSAPYWRAVWGTLQGKDRDPRAANMIERYTKARAPGVLKAYLAARTHALRWLDERVTRKNEEIVKPPIQVEELRRFRLLTSTVRDAAIDFMTLDHHVKVRDWLAVHMQPPSARVQTGKTIPVRDLVVDQGSLRVDFDLAPFGLTAAEMNLRTSFEEGSFVRLSPRMAALDAPQTFKMLTRGGATCVIDRIDWNAGQAWLSVVPTPAGAFYLASLDFTRPGLEVPSLATLDESISDFVAPHVQARLINRRNHAAFAWFDPVAPTIPPIEPLPAADTARIGGLLDTWPLPNLGQPLSIDQRQAVAAGLDTRVQLLLGPPGTGKTATTAASLLARCCLRHDVGQVVLVSAHTHLAVDEIVKRLAAYRPAFAAAARECGLVAPPVEIARAYTKLGDDEVPEGVHKIHPNGFVRIFKRTRREGVLVIAGTPGALLKLVSRGINEMPEYANVDGGFLADGLVVDEASMMVFPHFLALATLVGPDATIMLAGDHLQLAPIVAHDWDEEDRPPAVLFQPFRSAYEAVLRIIRERRPPAAAALRSPLTHTFRLPPEVRRLISNVYRTREEIELSGRGHAGVEPRSLANLDAVWGTDHGLVLITHTDRNSRQSNPTEAGIVRALLGSGLLAELQPSESVALLTPHRAQKARLQRMLDGDAARLVSIIDTVERLQGGENRTIIVCGTQSDPSAIGDAAEFILNLNRANVAFTRAKQRLIVICAETLLDHMPSDLENYGSAVLWKTLRSLCQNEIFRFDIDGVGARVLVPDDDVIPS